MTYTIAISVQKGGVGKTTTTGALLHFLSQTDRCLAIDLDPQGNLGKGLGITKTISPNCRNLLLEKNIGIKDTRTKTDDGLNVIPAYLDLGLARDQLSMQAMSGKRSVEVLGQKIEQCGEEWDWILLDCRGEGFLNSVALAAADEVLIPVQCQPYALEGLDTMLNIVGDIDILGILPTMSDRKTISRGVMKSLREFTRKSNIVLFPSIPTSTEFPNASDRGKPYTEDKTLMEGYRKTARYIQNKASIIDLLQKMSEEIKRCQGIISDVIGIAIALEWDRERIQQGVEKKAEIVTFLEQCNPEKDVSDEVELAIASGLGISLVEKAIESDRFEDIFASFRNWNGELRNFTEEDVESLREALRQGWSLSQFKNNGKKTRSRKQSPRSTSRRKNR